MRKYRRLKIGTDVARRVFAMFPGKWEVSQEVLNLPAQTFWRKTIADCTAGDYTEITREKGPAQQFEYRV
jgi:predicted acetyltransferase